MLAEAAINLVGAQGPSTHLAPGPSASPKTVDLGEKGAPLAGQGPLETVHQVSISLCI